MIIHSYLFWNIHLNNRICLLGENYGEVLVDLFEYMDDGWDWLLLDSTDKAYMEYRINGAR